MSVELGIVDFNTISVENIKNHVTNSRLEYLTHKYSDISLRNKYLLNTQKQHKLTTDRLKTKCKNSSKTFGKCESAVIKKVECTVHGYVMQVTSQYLIEQAIIKEKSNMFIIAYSSTLLQDNTAQNLGYSGE